MSDWFRVLFDAANSEDEFVLIYSYHTVLGDWQVHTPIKTFKIQPLKVKNSFYLFWADEKESNGVFHSVFDAIKAVAGHNTGVQEWDSSSFEAPDYLAKWKREIPKRVLFNFLDSWIKRNPNGSLREMVDYFEHEDMHFLGRIGVKKFLEEMIVSGQIERLPKDWMTPAELDGILRLAKNYGIPFDSPR